MRSPTAGSIMLTVTVTCSTPSATSRSAQSGRASPFVETHSLTSGSAAFTRSSVANVRSGFASGSPGPAMPTTESCGTSAATASTLRSASSGESRSLTTPGRLSFAQSYLRLQ
jgi:hypothetical protein